MKGRSTSARAAAALLVIAGVAAGLLLGPAALSPAELLRAALGQEGPSRTILLEVRLPRVTAALLVGGSLAVSGALFQALLRNPLAEPYLLGVSSGAAFGAVLAIGFGLLRYGAAVLPLAALAGGLLAIGVVFRAARTAARLDTTVLLLAGVVTGAFFAALVLLMLTFAREDTLRSAFFWTLGSLGGVSWREVAVLAAWVLPAAVVATALGRHLDALTLGERTAAALGTDVERLKRGIYLLASLLAAATVAVAGVIGFVGLVVPHAVRLLWGAAHRRLLPLAFLVGAGSLALADAGARTAAAPLEIPIGVVTAVVGVPFFLALLRRRSRP